MLEAIYNDLDDEVSKDPEDGLCTQAMNQSDTLNSLAAMYCPDMDTPAVERVSSWPQNFEESFCPS